MSLRSMQRSSCRSRTSAYSSGTCTGWSSHWAPPFLLIDISRTARSRPTQSFAWLWFSCTRWRCRTHSRSGFATIGPTTSTPTPTPIRTTPSEDFSSLTSAGSWLRSIRMWKSSDSGLIWLTLMLIRWSDFNANITIRWRSSLASCYRPGFFGTLSTRRSLTHGTQASSCTPSCCTSRGRSTRSRICTAPSHLTS